MKAGGFDPNCHRCDRLVDLRRNVRRDFPGYYSAPVPPFGDPGARLLIVGLAPGMHGANATGRPFTGDHAGILLYQTLFRYGLSNRPASIRRGDGLELRGCRITNAVKCLPPQNRPTGNEIATCNPYLARELGELGQPAVVVALGAIAHAAVLRALELRRHGYAFAHGAEHRLGDRRTLMSSYHCSRYNTQTGRLTEAMFCALFARVRALLDAL